MPHPEFEHELPAPQPIQLPSFGEPESAAAELQLPLRVEFAETQAATLFNPGEFIDFDESTQEVRLLLGDRCVATGILITSENRLGIQLTQVFRCNVSEAA